MMNIIANRIPHLIRRFLTAFGMTVSFIIETGRSGDWQDFISAFMITLANRRFFLHDHTTVCHSER